MSEIIKTNKEYSKWIMEVSQRFRKSQIKAAAKVNREMLIFYWSIGHDISENYNENIYGKSFYKNLSLDLNEALPDVKSFSVTNLKYMKYFYEMYSNSNRQQLVDDSMEEKDMSQHAIDECIFMIPWGHHIQIINKCKGNVDKALFFVKKAYENNWSRAVLLNFLNTGLYEREGKAINNFNKLLPEVGSDLAKEITKDPYNFDFLTLREGYDEKELKEALISNIQKHCYVVVEIKTRAFEPGDMGQLGTYIAATDGELRGEGDNPTLGLLICKTKDNVLAQYATSAINVPVGISEYELNNLMPEDYKSSMPTIEEIEKELNG